MIQYIVCPPIGPKLYVLLYLEKIGKPKKLQLLKEIYNRIKVITTINYGKLY